MYKRKTKVEFTPAQERKLQRLAKQRDRELVSRFCQYVSAALTDQTRTRFSLVVWDGHIDSISRQPLQTNEVKSERIGRRSERVFGEN